jgi:hypothetical protein
MEIYSDFSFFVELQKNSELKKRIINDTKNNEYYYSPAHLEEIANILRSCSNKTDAVRYMTSNISLLHRLTKGKEYLQDKSSQYKRINEHPMFCIGRVFKYYNITLEEEINQKNFFTNREYIREIFIKECGLPKNEISSIPPEELTRQGYFLKCIEKFNSIVDKNCIFSYTWNDIKEKYDVSCHIEQLLNIIECMGYNSDKNKKYRNRLHDNAHIIYATNSDIFVSNDIKQIRKCKVVYLFYGITTKVMNIDEYLKYLAKN